MTAATTTGLDLLRDRMARAMGAQMPGHIEEALRRVGLPAPRVVIRRVQGLDRDALTGKARRYMPLRWPSAASTSGAMSS